MTPENSDDSSDSDYDLEENVAPTDRRGNKTDNKDGFEVVTQDPGTFLIVYLQYFF